MLYIKGENPKGLDGIFGTNTNNAVKSFQQKESILIDGKAGKVTWEKLFL
ncbi:peptidoglycan-binding protein [Oceanobacillus kimchii]|nr:peptidoglycan-binding protein [Oceanobacillus kimchii]MCT2135798.1 peptidoglycan-binding protein [Oceanobacillus kimchii]